MPAVWIQNEQLVSHPTPGDEAMAIRLQLMQQCVGIDVIEVVPGRYRRMGRRRTVL